MVVSALREFIVEHRSEIIARCRALVASRPAPRATDLELEHGVPLFLDQMIEAFGDTSTPTSTITTTAMKHASELRQRGFTVAQVVHDYGGVCQTITNLAAEKGASISATDFHTFNRLLDDAIAGAVTEYGRLREHEGTERLGRLSHDLRDLLHRSLLAFDALKSGSVGMTGATADVLARSLGGLKKLIDRELAEVRIEAGLHYAETISIHELLEDLEVVSAMEARARGMTFSTTSSVPAEIVRRADRQAIESILGNLVQNAFKFTRAGGSVAVDTHVTNDRVVFDVRDECGGLPAGSIEDLFRPFEQRGRDRGGLGLGLALCYQSARTNGGEIKVVDRPGIGCVFSLELPRHER
jgi:signal transduction histidine kinase